MIPGSVSAFKSKRELVRSKLAYKRSRRLYAGFCTRERVEGEKSCIMQQLIVMTRCLFVMPGNRFDATGNFTWLVAALWQS